MTDEQAILVQREAIARYCRGDRKLALKIIDELGKEMRNWVEARRQEKVTADDLYKVIKFAAGC